MDSRCRNVRLLINRFLDGDLEEKGASQLKNHLDRCPDCSSLLEKERDIITMFELLPELDCPENVVQNIEAATLGGDRSWFSIRKPGAAFLSFDFPVWRLLAVGGFLAAVILLIARYPVTSEREHLPAGYSHEEAQKVRKTAKWSVVYAAGKLGTTGNEVISETMRTHIPEAVKRSIRNISLPVNGG